MHSTSTAIRAGRSSLRRRMPAGETRRQRGQVIVMFALGLTSIMAMVALLIDGGLAWGNRRQAQAAADTAALAAMKEIVSSATPNITAAAASMASQNGFASGSVSCGSATAQAIVVNRPPLTGPHSDAVNPA